MEVGSTGQASSGNISIEVGNLTLEDRGLISASTNSGNGGLLDINVGNTLSMRDNSLISAEAGGNGDGGNIDIDAKFIIAHPNQNNDIVTNAESGTGGNITITTEAILGLDIRSSTPENTTNDIDVSSKFGLSGDFRLNILNNVDISQTVIEVSNNVVEPEKTVAQACSIDQEGIVQNSLTINGKGGIPSQPTEPLYSDLILVNGQTSTPKPEAQYFDIKPIKTSIGDIYPARGIIKTEDGGFILTAYPTDIDTRTPQIQENCTRS